MASSSRFVAVVVTLLFSHRVLADPLPPPPPAAAPQTGAPAQGNAPAPVAPPDTGRPPPAAGPAPVSPMPSGYGEQQAPPGTVLVPQWAAPAQAAYGPPVPVTIVAADGERLAIAVFPEWAKAFTVAPLAECFAPCSLQMQRGAYRIAIRETSDTLAGDRVVTVDGSSRVVVTPKTPAQRTGGLLLGIAGPILLLVGAVVAIGNAAAECFGDTCDSSHQGGTTAGLLLMLGGAVLTPVGWVMFGTSHHPGMDVEHTGATAKVLPAFGIMPFRGGLGLGGGITF